MYTQDIEALQKAELTEQEDSLLYSITLSGKNLFRPCSVCSSMHPRVPYEIEDKNGLPVCHLCATKVTPDIYYLLRQYIIKIPMREGIVNIGEEERRSYFFSVGFDKDFTDEESIGKIETNVASTLRKFGVFAFYYTNICGGGQNVIIGMVQNRVSQKRARKAIQEVIINDEKADRVMKYLFMFDMKIEKQLYAQEQ